MPVEPRRAIVFGGAGFIGTHLVQSLAASGTQVVVADLSAPSALPPNASFQHCDLRRPVEIRRDRPFDSVYNLAAVHRTPGHDPYEYWEANVGGALNLVQWMEEGGENSLYFTSSIAVYGPSEDLKTEASPPEPISDYGRSKLLSERLFKHWREASGQRKLVIMRPAVVFGPGEGGNFTRLAAALKRQLFVYPGRDDVIKSCGYVGDLVKAFAFAESLPDQDLLFNYCYPERSTIADICEAFHEVAGYKLPKMLPPALVGAAIATLGTINPRERGSVSAARVKKLTASTNIAAEALVARGFEWDTDVRSALASWRLVSSDGDFR